MGFEISPFDVIYNMLYDGILYDYDIIVDVLYFIFQNYLHMTYVDQIVINLSIPSKALIIGH